MAPGYRPNNRRQNRTGYVDHDVFEGLPVRHWRRDYVTVAPPPPSQDNPASQNDVWAVELPYGMPKDSHLLPQHSQDLLRAARSGKIYKRPAPVEEEEVDADAILGDKPEKKEEDPRNSGFTAKAWKLIPRHLEGPDVEYLAKRRKGVVTVAQKSASTAAPVLTRATVKRMDAAGNEYVQDVVVAQGQPVDGEVISQRIIQDPSTATLGSVSFAPQIPSKRKVPPPRKKSKGTGKGKKKKPMPPTSVSQANEALQSAEGAGAATGHDGVKIENESGGALEDTEMADGSAAASDDEDGEEGEEGEEGDDDDEEATPADDSASDKPAQILSPAPADGLTTEDAPSIDQPDTAVTDFAQSDTFVPSTGPKVAEGSVGSPLGNVALTTSTLSSLAESPAEGEAAPAEEVNEVPEITEVAALDEVMQQEVEETAPTALPLPPPEPTIAEVTAAVEVLQEEEEEEEMLLDIVDNAENAEIGEGEVSFAPAPKVEAPQDEASEVEAPQDGAPEGGAPEDEAPEDEAPEYEAPQDEAPQDEAPQDEAPQDEATEDEAPEIEVPEDEAPEDEAPEIEVPEDEAPEDEAPDIEAPDVEAPGAEAPEPVDPPTEQETEPAAEPQVAEEEKAAAVQAEGGDDHMPDLLGGLEKQLNETEAEKADV